MAPSSPSCYSTLIFLLDLLEYKKLAPDKRIKVPSGCTTAAATIQLFTDVFQEIILKEKNENMKALKIEKGTKYAKI